jgi:hypothetical protein
VLKNYLVAVIRDRLLAWRSEIVFTDHGVMLEGTEFIAELITGRGNHSKASRQRPSGDPSNLWTAVVTVAECISSEQTLSIDAEK